MGMLNELRVVCFCLSVAQTLTFAPSQDNLSRGSRLFSTTKADVLSLSLEKPLGMMLEEVAEDEPKGVYVIELADEGSATSFPEMVGLQLETVMNEDVTNLLFDDVMDKLINAPSPVSVSFSRSNKISSATEGEALSLTLEKPLGMMLEEVAEGEPKGVYVLELAEEGSATKFPEIVGLQLGTVMNEDVRNLSFDDVMTKLVDAPSPISLSFVTKEEKGAAFAVGTDVKIKVIDGDKDTTISAKVGDNLRQILFENNFEVYKGLKQKLGNCGGGGQCGFCAVEFVAEEGWEPRSDYEAQKLKQAPKSRLSCLNNVQGPVTIKL